MRSHAQDGRQQSVPSSRSSADRTPRLGCGMLAPWFALLSGACDPASTDALGADARVEDAGAPAPLAFAIRELETACLGEVYEGALVVTGGARPLRNSRAPLPAAPRALRFRSR